MTRVGVAQRISIESYAGSTGTTRPVVSALTRGVRTDHSRRHLAVERERALAPLEA